MTNSEPETEEQRKHRVKTIFIRAHVSLACDGDKLNDPMVGVVPSIRRHTEASYFTEAWEKHGGWD